jgi:glycosyltransferase involved in cell wall biosynthesis
MRIALLTHKVDFNDGQGRVYYEIVMAALNAGHEVTVVAEFCSDDIARHPRGAFARMRNHPLPTQLARNMYFAAKSASWLRKNRHRFDVIQANGFVTWEPADIVAVHYVHTAWLKNPLFEFHWSSFSPYAWYQRVMAIVNSHYERKAFASAEVIIAVSGFTASEVASLGIPREKIMVVHNGVDLREFHPGDADRAQFNLPVDVPLGLFVGDIKTTRKNLDAVLKAMVRVPELHLAVAGKLDGSPYPAMASELGLSDRVHFVGKTSKVPLLMRSADFFVFPSRYEAHPLVLMEAMASRLPIIVSDNFGASDYLAGGGIVFNDPDDIEALAGAMRRMITDPSARNQFAEAAYQQALKMQWSDTAAKYLAIYDRFMEGRTPKV